MLSFLTTTYLGENMIDVIPAGQNAVVTPNIGDCHDRRDGDFYNGAERVKDALATYEINAAQTRGDILKTIKDSEAGALKTSKEVEVAVRDAEAHALKTAKEVEVAVRDAEAFLAKTIKESEAATEAAKAQVLKAVKESEIATEAAKAKIVEEVNEVKFENERAECYTRERFSDSFKDQLLQNCENTDKIMHEMHGARNELLLSQRDGFRDQLLEHKNGQTLSLKLAANAEKTAATNHNAEMLEFKEQALLSERLAAKQAKEAFEYKCEIKELIRSDGQATRDLINHCETEKLRAQLQRKDAQLSAYFSRNMAPVTP